MLVEDSPDHRLAHTGRPHRWRHRSVPAAHSAQATSCRRDKLALARLLAITPWTLGARATEKKLRLIRVFNYHGTPPRYATSFGKQIDHLLDRYTPIDPYRLEETLAVGPPDSKPAAIFTFDDGLRNHFTVAAAELERRGVRGIFCPPVEFPSVPLDLQIDWFRSRVRPTADAEHARRDDLYAMTWDQARELVARGHRLCCHSLSHEVFRWTTSIETLRAEIQDSRYRMEEKLRVPVDGFCWPVTRDRGATAALELVRATYRYALVDETQPLFKGHDPLDVNRTRLEASWPTEALDFQISGIMDALFLMRRWRASAFK